MRFLPRARGTLAVAALCAFACTLYGARAVIGSDHQDAPLTVSRPGIDLTDVYVFPDPHARDRVVLAMDVWPLIPTGMAAMAHFDPAAMYQFKIGTDDRFTEDLVIQFRAQGTGDAQSVAVYGPAKPAMQGTLSSFGTQTGSVAFNKTALLANGVRVFAGPREDPFFFDLAQFYAIEPDRNFANQPNVPAPIAGCFRKPGMDFLAGFNVLSLVVDVPRKLLADPNGHIGRINVWATTSLPSDDADLMPNAPRSLLAQVTQHVNEILGGTPSSATTYAQVERLARPAVKESMERFADHDTTNRSPITDDGVLANSIVNFATNVAGRSPKIAKALQRVLIPDAIEADLSATGPARYLAVETNGKSGLPVAVVRLVPPAGIYGVKRALGDPYRQFGGRDLASPVIDLSLGAIFGSLLPKLGLAPEDRHERACLTSDHVTPAAKHFIAGFPYIGDPR